MRAFFGAIATMAVQGSVLKWVANHRRHHLYADKPGDVHSPHYDGLGHRQGRPRLGGGEHVGRLALAHHHVIGHEQLAGHAHRVIDGHEVSLRWLVASE